MMMVMMTGEYFKDEMKEMQKNNENHGGKWKIRNSNTALGSGAGLNRHVRAELFFFNFVIFTRKNFLI